MISPSSTRAASAGLLHALEDLLTRRSHLTSANVDVWARADLHGPFRRAARPLDHVVLDAARGEPDRVRDRAPRRVAVRDHRRGRAGRGGRRRRTCPGRAGAQLARGGRISSRRPCRASVEAISRSASSSVLIVPSSSFRQTLPVKPSVTTTSAAPSSSSRHSTLPSKCRSLAARSSCASSVSWFPFSASSPIESSRPAGRVDARGSPPRRPRPCGRTGAGARGARRRSRRRRAGRSGRAARGSARDRRAAHAREAGAGGGARPRASRRCCRRRRRRRPPRRRRARRRSTSELSGLARTASAGFSSISIASAPRRARAPASRPARPEEDHGDALGAASSAPATTSSGRAIAAEGVDRDASHYGGLEARAARPRGPCRCRRSGRRGGVAWAARSSGRRSGAAPRWRAARGACRGGTWTSSAWGRP